MGFSLVYINNNHIMYTQSRNVLCIVYNIPKHFTKWNSFRFAAQNNVDGYKPPKMIKLSDDTHSHNYNSYQNKLYGKFIAILPDMYIRIRTTGNSSL